MPRQEQELGNTLKIHKIYLSSLPDFAYGGQGARHYTPKCVKLTWASACLILQGVWHNVQKCIKMSCAPTLTKLLSPYNTLHETLFIEITLWLSQGGSTAHFDEFLYVMPGSLHNQAARGSGQFGTFWCVMPGSLPAIGKIREGAQVHFVDF